MGISARILRKCCPPVLEGMMLGFSSMSRVCVLPGLALSLLLFVPLAARADEPDSLPKLDMSQNNLPPEFPSTSQTNGDHGDVTIAVDIDATGKPLTAKVKTSSGFTDLDQAAVTAALGWHYLAAVKDGTPVEAWTKIVVHFQITDATLTPPFGYQAYAVKRPGDIIICKSGVGATGTLIPQPKRCLPRREWDRITAGTKEQMDRMIRSGDLVGPHQ
jgi:TonB family protein